MRLTKKYLKEIALERIHTLFKEAKKRPAYANRYVEIARNISMKVNLPMPKEYKRKYCKHCYTYFDKDSLRVRTGKGFVSYTCLRCKKQMRFKLS